MDARAYNRDSQSVGSSYSRDPNSGYKRDSKSASGTYQRDSTTSDSATYNRDSQSASASFPGRDSQSSAGFRDSQSGAAGFGNQAGSYPRDTGSQQPQTGFNPKPYRNSTEQVPTSLQTSLTGSKLVESFSKMGVTDGSLGSSPSTNSQVIISTVDPICIYLFAVGLVFNISFNSCSLPLIWIYCFPFIFSLS